MNQHGGTKKTAVLAFSGGLDTSFCVPWLKDRGYEVVTLFVDTGGVDAEERKYIEERARALGALDHETYDGAQDIWDEVVVPLVIGGQLYQDTYPLLVSDRYIIVEQSLRLADRRGTKVFAHGCTGMGNDQVRFDQTVRSLGDYEIVAPIREIQQEHRAVRAYEATFLEERGFPVRAKTTRYSINQNLLGVTASGSEIDEFQAPGDETWTLCAHPSRWPREALRVRIGFEKGVAVTLDGAALPGPEILKALNERMGAYGVGRGIYTGDTTIGLKGRIVFECPGITALMVAHRALEEAVLTAHQNTFKPAVAKKWVELVYKGFFFEPLKADLEAFLRQSQAFVSGEVTLETWGGTALPVAVSSEHILRNKGAVYAQSADWGAREAEGFIKLYGMSSTLSAAINPAGRGGKAAAKG
ncbi:argininosuccinate synthase [Chondromyces apiculatus]|uniref:argininosuccinate synthase n=1 Tax=Chondromyces apiculatus DSM 436 TaxID=1192034 RepID=A0A017SUM7_9BACT|nr:argininosuccinate synthase [Chondromyces apiculatus]EYF00688.1 Argininosuccinate synthase [Chondromyces apiculatus DSM 436]